MNDNLERKRKRRSEENANPFSNGRKYLFTLELESFEKKPNARR